MRQSLEDKFLDFIEDKLSPSDKEAFSSELASDKELQRAFAAYKKLMQTEVKIASTQTKSSSYFNSKVMNEIREKDVGFFRRMFMEVGSKQKWLYGAVASFATLVVLIKAAELGKNQGSYKEMVFKDEQIQTEAKPQIETGAKDQSDEKNGPILAREITSVDADKKASTVAKVTSEKIALEDKSKIANEPVRKENNASIVAPVEQDLREAKQFPELSKNKGDQIAAPKVEAAAGVSADGLASQAKPIPPPPPGALIHKRQLSVYESMPADDYLAIQEPANSEEYNHYGENPRLNVFDQPSSTFSIDVDTASYTNARRFLKAGNLPPKDSIRVEEFINYFNYDYPVQYDKAFSLSYEIAPSPLEQDRLLLKLGIKSKDQKNDHKPWNLVFLVDVSGSMMDANKLPLVKQSLKLLVDKMGSRDKIGIVTYAGAAGVALESSGINDKSKIINAIDGLAAGGSTNGSGGIMAAYDLALRNKISEGVNRVVLATDGDFNVGVTSHEELIRLIEEKRKSGVTLTGLSYGTGNLKDATLEQLANKGNGNYFYIDSFQEARKVLETDLTANMEVVAKDVKLQIEFNPNKVISYRLVGYENRKLNREDFNNDAIDAGEIGAGHTVTAIYEVVLAGSELSKTLNDSYRYQQNNKEEVVKDAQKANLNNSSSELAFLKIRYKEPEAEQSKLLEYPINASDVKTSLDKASDDFKFAAAVSYFAQILRGSQFVGKYNYQDVVELAQSSKGEDKNGYRQEFIELVKNAKAVNSN